VARRGAVFETSKGRHWREKIKTQEVIRHTEVRGGKANRRQRGVKIGLGGKRFEEHPTKGGTMKSEKTV